MVVDVLQLEELKSAKNKHLMMKYRLKLILYPILANHHKKNNRNILLLKNKKISREEITNNDKPKFSLIDILINISKLIKKIFILLKISISNNQRSIGTVKAPTAVIQKQHQSPRALTNNHKNRIILITVRTLSTLKSIIDLQNNHRRIMINKEHQLKDLQLYQEW